MPCAVQCPACGADGTGAANEALTALMTHSQKPVLVQPESPREEAAPKSSVSPAEAVRRQHLGREQVIQGIGLLYSIFAVLLLIAMVTVPYRIGWRFRWSLC